MLLASIVLTLAGATAQNPAKLAETYVDAVQKLNRDHARKPGDTTEDELGTKLPKKATAALSKLLQLDPSEEVDAGLAEAAGAALELARVEDFDALKARLAENDPAAAQALGAALARPRYLLLGENGVELDYLEGFAEIFDAVLAGYDELFGFAEWSKVPGKKLRVRVHRVDRIERPPHFAPQFPGHSEIDFPVVDVESFKSPTADGKFLFYGLCHELGHVIAMWGDRNLEEDRHAWAHYTGVLLVEHLSDEVDEPWIKRARDVEWRSLSKERERLADTEPGLDDRDAVLALLFALHELVGPQAIGEAINELDEEDRRLRVNHVRYYRFSELRDALLANAKGKRTKKKIEALLP